MDGKVQEVTTFQKWPCKEEDITILNKTYRLPHNIHYFVTQEIIPEIKIEWVTNTSG